MTVTTTIDRVTYQGNGVAGDFAYPFKIFAASNLVVELVDDTTGTVTPQSLGNDYGVSGVGRDDGGRVSFFVVPAAGVTVRIRRVLPIVQEADFTSQGVFYPERHENALDYLTACLQSLSVSADNALQLSADGSVWDGESLRLTNVADGESPQDAATLGQLEQVVQNLAAGQSAFAPLFWQYTAAGEFVYPLPGASLTRPDAYTVTWDGLVQPPASYVVGTSSNPFVMTFDSIPPIGATILIRCIGVAEMLSSANIDASGVVSGQFDPARLGSGVANDAVFLAGGPGAPTWTNYLSGPLQIDGDITTGGQFIGSADTSLITTGVFPPNRLGTGVYGVNTVLHGDGVYRIPAVATTTGFGVSDAVNAPAVFTAIELTGDISESAEANPINVAKVKTYIKNDAGGTATLEGYVTELFPAAFGLVSGPAVMMQPGNGSDSADWWPATTNDRVLMRRSDSLNFFKLPVAAIDATGSPGSGNYLRGDGTWSAPVASLGSSVATDPAGNTPTYPGTGAFFRADSQWANTIVGEFYVQGASGTPPAFQIATNLTQVTFGAIRNSLEIPLTFNSWTEISAVGGALLSNNEASDRLAVNGRVRATRLREEGSSMVRMQSTATSGAVTLDHNAYGHFITTPSGNVTYTFSDGGTDPSVGTYASEFTLEIVSPGANVMTFPVGTVWAGGTAPTLASAARNLLKFTKRQGVSGYIGVLLDSGGGGFTTEDAQDAVGAMIANSSTVTLTYNDATPSLTAAVPAGAIGPTQLATNAVEEAKIANAAVTNLKVASGSLTVDRLAATGTRDAAHVLSGADTWVPLSSGGGQVQIQFKDEGSNVGGIGTINAVNFTGSAVTASAVGNTLNVAVTAGGQIIWADDGIPLSNSSVHSTLSFGTGIAASLLSGGVIRIDATGGGGGGGQSSIQFKDEGVAIGGSGAITSFDVVGAGASLSVTGTAATLTIPGGGGSTQQGVYNVRDYGAVGNGVTSDSSAIAAAIAAAGSSGGTVYFPPGVYRITSTIALGGSKVSLAGASRETSILDWGGSGAGTMISVQGVTSGTRITDIWLRGGSTRPTKAITIGSLVHGYFARLRLTEFTGFGIDAVPDTSTVMAWNHFEQVEIDARNNGVTTTAVGIRMDGGNGSPSIPNCCHNTLLGINVAHNDNTYGVTMLDTDNNTFWQLYTFRVNPYTDSGAGIHFGTNARANTVYHCQADVVANGSTACKNAIYYNDRENGVPEPEVTGAAEILWTSSGNGAYNGMNFRTAAGTYRMYFDTALGDIAFSAPNSGGVKRANSI